MFGTITTHIHASGGLENPEGLEPFHVALQKLHNLLNMDLPTWQLRIEAHWKKFHVNIIKQDDVSINIKNKTLDACFAAALFHIIEHMASNYPALQPAFHATAAEIQPLNPDTRLGLLFAIFEKHINQSLAASHQKEAVQLQKDGTLHGGHAKQHADSYKAIEAFTTRFHSILGADLPPWILHIPDEHPSQLHITKGSETIQYNEHTNTRVLLDLIAEKACDTSYPHRSICQGVHSMREHLIREKPETLLDHLADQMNHTMLFQNSLQKPHYQFALDPL